MLTYIFLLDLSANLFALSAYGTYRGMVGESRSGP